MNLWPWLERHRVLVAITFIALAVMGGFVAYALPSGIYPEVEFPRIVVVAREAEVPAAEIQRSIVRPLENALATVQGIERIRSRAIRGGTEIGLQFAPGTDMWRALQLVQAQVGDTRSELPPGAEVLVERLTTTSFPVVTFNLTGNIDPRRLRELAEFVLRPAISRVRGVGRIEVLGGDVREVEVVLDPERTAALHLRPADLVEKLRASSVLQAVGRLDESRALVTVVASSEPRVLDDLLQIPIASGPDGSPVPLSAIATVTEGAEDRLLAVNGPAGETVLISVSRLPGASTPKVVDEVRAVAADVARSFPAGVLVTPVYDQAALVDEAMRSVRDAILLGIALCVILIATFLRDVRAGMVAAISIPLTLGGTFVFVRLFGQSLNLMSLGGIAVSIGLVIDDAIVVVESIGRFLEEGASPKDAARRGTAALAAAVIGTTATTVIVFVPLAAIEGVAGRFFVTLAVTLGAAVVLSLLVALLVVPMAAAGWLRVRPRTAREPRLPILYRKMLGALLRHSWLGAAAVVGIVVLGVVGYRFVPTDFLPSMDEGAFVVDYFLPASTSLKETDRVARKIEAILLENPDVATYSRRTGAELGPINATLVSRGDIMVRLRSPDKREHSTDEVIAEIRAKVESAVPEARTEFIQVLQDVLNDLAGTPRPIEIKLFGDDYAILRAKAKEVAERIRNVDGLVDLYEGFEADSPELRFRIDPAAAGRLGKAPVEVAADLEASLRGVEAGIFRRPDRPIRVRVRYPDAVRFNPSRVEALPFAYGPQGIVPISAIATFERKSVDTVLMRESLRPVVIVAADHEDRDLGSVVRDIEQRLKGFTLPAGYRMELGGQYAGQQQTLHELGAVMGFGLIAVLIVLLAQFQRPRLAFLVLITAPLAVVGAILTLWLLNVPLNASSLMGCILLVGLVVKNGILLLERAEGFLDDGRPIDQALADAGAERLRPILMTTVATIAGLGPLALGIGSGAELQRPLALAVVGGLLVSTGLSLFVLPSLVKLTSKRTASQI